jgi:hypothetical protein
MNTKLMIFVSLIITTTLICSVEEEVTKYIRYRQLQNLSIRSCSIILEQTSAEIDNLKRYIIESHYGASEEQKIKRTNFAKHIVSLKEELRAHDSMMRKFKQQLNPIIQECEDTETCAVFEKEYDQLHNELEAILSSASHLKEKVELMHTHELYKEWRIHKSRKSKGFSQ